MADDVVARVLAHPRYRELVRRRGRARLGFFLLMLVIYFGFILTLAFASHVLAMPVRAGATMTVGVVVAIAVEVSAMAMIGTYVYLSGRRYDPLLDAILEDVK